MQLIQAILMENTPCFNTYFFHLLGKASVNCTQFWGNYGNGYKGIHDKCHMAVVELKQCT